MKAIGRWIGDTYWVECKLGELDEGDLFWLMGRSFIVRGKERGEVQTECLDDGGEPSFTIYHIVETPLRFE